MAKNLNVSWVLPTTRASGKPLAKSEIAFVELGLSSDNVNWTVYDTFTPDVLATVIPELDNGTWYVAGTVVDTKERRSVSVVQSIQIVPPVEEEDTTPPGVLTLTLSL